MSFDLALAGVVAIGLLVYLVVVLMTPERF
ncbi:MAG: ATPase [Blastomonas sp. CACIA14H2]|jgi:K+-transporting ATPase KdpF subunit|nr:K(+)-transporting ATPase subunit F [Sphingomonas ursincola]ESZ87620.1 MAG: ATPase [Blastomonas sp. CACIA14H2]MBA4780347.1 K(+)-transporting ATPase subunit F [Blastomonas sp.]OHD02635.1 MAG: potassium-transporting ATPase subunit F [Sphingopyxis sp. RIFCSPHIGHO2_01_FULL_65_24]MBY0619025.1 K(+)-transporting ATPase subunit F [Sphingomonas ursincola]MCH2236535.1 K(+)-transporting ATPase subunit F [Blastomonas sp.]